ncbi:hypothetical protein [Bacillus thuringiensis]|uniref:hypothetical protein n=1 Tax=Bacillus thuringiensis TaxID=1428 RepID=UPI000BFD2851|nr:hypothetical protein [Bacillus thuringiensis]PGT89854.1 hypothetical protein COD17_08885 [Bacillus thuringiensis]
MARLTKKVVDEKTVQMYNNLRFMEKVYREVTTKLFFHDYEVSKDFRLDYWNKKLLGCFEHPSRMYLDDAFANSHKLAQLQERYEVACTLYEELCTFFTVSLETEKIDMQATKERYEYQTGATITVAM